MSNQVVWESLGNISESYIMDAMPPSWHPTGAGEQPSKRSRLSEFFLDSGWVAAVLSAVVAISVIVAIVLAGRGDPVVPPVGTNGESTEDTSPIEESAPAEETTPAPEVRLPDLPEGSRILSTVEEPIGEHLLRMHVFRVETDPTAPPFLSRGLYIELIDPATDTALHHSVHRGYVTLSVINMSDETKYGLLEIGRISDAPDKLQAVCSFLDVVPADGSDETLTLSFTEQSRAEAPLGESGVTSLDNNDWTRPLSRMIVLLRLSSAADYAHLVATSDPHLTYRQAREDSGEEVSQYWINLQTPKPLNLYLLTEPADVPGPVTELTASYVPQDARIVPIKVGAANDSVAYLRMTAYRTIVTQYHPWPTGIYFELIQSKSAENVTVHPDPSAGAPILAEDSEILSEYRNEQTAGYNTVLALTNGDTTEYLFLTLSPLSLELTSEHIVELSLCVLQANNAPKGWEIDCTQLCGTSLYFTAPDLSAGNKANHAAFLSAVREKIEGADKVSIRLSTDNLLQQAYTDGPADEDDKAILLRYLQSLTPADLDHAFFEAADGDGNNAVS